VGLKKAQQALEQCREINYEYGLAVCLRILALNHITHNEFQQAQKMLEESIGIFHNNENEYEQARSESIKTKIYNYTGDFKKVIENADKCIVVFEKYNDVNELASCYNDLGIAHHRLDNVRAAIIYFEKSAGYFLRLGKKNAVCAGSFQLQQLLRTHRQPG